MQLTDTQQDDGRFGGDSDRKWEHIANAQVDVVIGMMRSGLDADSILETFCNLEEFYPHLASPKKVTELLKKVIVACVPKLKHTAPGCKLNAMGFIAGWIMAKMAETRASDPEFLTTCEAAHSAISALATSLTRKDLLGPSDERRMGQVAAALVISWSGVLGNSITEKTIAGYFRSSYEVAWKALDRAGGDEVTKNFKRITVDLARNHGVVDKVTAWLDAHVTSRTAKRNQK